MAEAKDLDPLYEALRNASAAGDEPAMQKLAGAIRAKEATPSSGKVESMDATGADAVARGISDFFTPQAPKDVSGGEYAGAIAGGAATGAAAGAFMPQALQMAGKGLGAAGKVLPGALGRGATALGEGAQAMGSSMSRLPVGERALQGAGGGAAMGAAEKVGEQMGVSPATKLGMSLVGGGVGEAGASLLAKEGKLILSVFGNAAMGNVGGIARAGKGMLEPNKPLNEATAKRVQAQLFGEPTPNYIDGLVSSEAKTATAAKLRAADPSLPPLNVDPTRASELYRNKMFEGVTDAVKSGKRFSDTPEFKNFKDEMQVMVKLGDVSPGEARSLIRNLQADGLKPQAKPLPGAGPQGAGYLKNLTTPTAAQAGAVPKQDPKVLEGYAKMVDDRIRQWGKPQEVGGQTGAAAVSAGTSKEVREKLQVAYNGYLQKLGMGPMETKYRGAYAEESKAKAVDELQYFLSGRGTGTEFAAMARNVAKDPAALPVVQQGMRKQLANTPPEAIVKEFGRMEKALLNSKMLGLEDISTLRKAADVVSSINDKGLKQKYSLRLKQMVLLRAAGSAGVAAGGAAGASAGGGE